MVVCVIGVCWLRGSKRKAIDEGNTSTSKEPRTSIAEPEQERLEEQPTEQAQQPHREQIEEEQPAQADEVDSPEQTDAGDDTTRADDDGLKIRALPKILTKATIHITADDVAAVLGLPKGNIEITKRTAKVIPAILKEWRWLVEKTTAYITPRALTRKMVEVDAADLWFRHHFALLVMSVLIDPMVNGYVNQNYIDHLLDVGNIPNLNWSQMVINALINSKQVWMKSADKLYGGPILFLMVFYVDRVVLFRRIVPRSFPAFKNWTFKLLSKRECDEIKLGGFGYGHVDTALRLENAPPEEGNPSIPVSDVSHPPQPPQHL
nr:uncharacterized protein LOC109191529 [Ipomoea batatas]